MTSKINETIDMKLELKRQKLKAHTAIWKGKTEPLAHFILHRLSLDTWLPVQHNEATTALMEAKNRSNSITMV